MFSPRALRALLISVLLIAGMSLVALPLVKAATAAVTVTWAIPTDKTISVSYPTALTEVRFSPSSMTFARLAANSQTDGVGAFRVTNDGNVVLAISGMFNDHVPTGVAEFLIADSSVSGVPTGGLLRWCGAISDTGQTPAGGCTGTVTDTTSQSMLASLAVGANKIWWSWSWGTAATAGTNSDTFTLTST